MIMVILRKGGYVHFMKLRVITETRREGVGSEERMKEKKPDHNVDKLFGCLY